MKYALTAFMVVGMACVLSAAVTAMTVLVCDFPYYLNRFRKWLNGLVQ